METRKTARRKSRVNTKSRLIKILCQQHGYENVTVLHQMTVKQLEKVLRAFQDAELDAEVDATPEEVL